MGNVGFALLLAVTGCSRTDFTRADGEPCLRNLECAHICLGGFCTTQSAAGTSCDADDTEDCLPSLLCVERVCVQEQGTTCTEDSMCEMRCVAGVCEPPSEIGGPCDPGQDADCITGAVCELGICRGGEGSPCTLNSECPSTCVAGACTGPATTDVICDVGDADDCATGDVCVAGLCLGDSGTSCAANSDCAVTCLAGLCVGSVARDGPCDLDDDADCPAGDVCEAGVCRGGTGASCSANSDCLETCIQETCATPSDVGLPCDTDDHEDCVTGLGCFTEACAQPPPITDNEPAGSLLPGDSIQLVISGGVGPFTINDSGTGFLDPGTLAYTVPSGTASVVDTITVTDALGSTHEITITITGVGSLSTITLPMGIGDQNYGKALIHLDTGTLLASTIYIDGGLAYERWATFRSTDDGMTWSRVDTYSALDYGESHAMSMSTDGTTAYACGYIWAFNPNGAEWIVRRSTDDGVTWSTVDRWYPTSGLDHVCYDVYADPATGHAYAAGTAEGTWTVRESTDGGDTWQTILDRPGAGFSAASNVTMENDGTLWVLGENDSAVAEVMRGDGGPGSWTFTDATGDLPAVGLTGPYQSQGDIVSIGPDTLLISTSSWRMFRSVDAGASWVEVFTPATPAVGGQILQASSGTLLATGRIRNGPREWHIVRSDDGGDTWQTVRQEPGPDGARASEGVGLAETASGTIVSLGYLNGTYQSTVARSGDDGLTWSNGGDIEYVGWFYPYMYAFVTDDSGRYYVGGWLTDEDFNGPWVIMRSDDQGGTWVEADRIDVAQEYHEVHDLAVGPAGAVYAIGETSTDVLVRKSLDGSAWSTIDTLPGSGWLMAVGSNGTVHYTTLDGQYRSDEGGAFATHTTFPHEAGSTRFYAYELLVAPNGDVWLVMRAENSSAVFESFALRRPNGSGAWEESMRVASSAGGAIACSDTGTLTLIMDGAAFSSSDDGATWTPIALPGGTPVSVAQVGDAPVFLTSDWLVIEHSPTTGDWVVVNDESTETALDYYADRVASCGTHACVIGSYGDPVLGTIVVLRPLP